MCAGALQALRRLREQHDLHVVTSRQFAIRDETLRWIDEHFPGVFSGVHFGNHWAESGPARPKSRICREIGAHMLIDDNPEYARECAAHGIRVLLYNWRLGYPWSEQPDRCAPWTAATCCRALGMAPAIWDAFLLGRGPACLEWQGRVCLPESCAFDLIRRCQIRFERGGQCRLTHPNITVVSSWEDVEAHIGALDVPALHQA